MPPNFRVGGIGISSSKEKKFRSAELDVFPVKTAGGVNQKIYQVQLNAYQDFYIFKKINTSISLEANYYTDGLLSRDTIGPVIIPTRLANNKKKYTPLADGSTRVDDFDDAYDGALTLRFMWDDGAVKKSKFIPFIESQASYGSRDLTIGYPYWIIEHRLYGGGGIGWEYTSGNFHSKIEGGAFLDDFSDHFERLTGGISYQLFDFTALTLNVEVFEQKKYYSNSVQFGIKHNFKPRYKKRK